MIGGKPPMGPEVRSAGCSALLGALFAGSAILGTEIPYSPRDLALLSIAYLCLAVALDLGTRAGHRLWWPLGLVGSVVIGVVTMWHLRFQIADVPKGHSLMLAGALGFGVVHALTLPKPAEQLSLKRSAGLAAATLVALVCLLSLFQRVMPSLTSHILQRNQLLGLAMYYGLTEDAEVVFARVRAADATAQPRSVQAPPATATVRDESLGRAPNQVLIVLDTLRADMIGLYGGDPSVMPRVNAFASTSVVFTDVMANASWTRPSVASMLTGEVQEVHGAIDWWTAVHADIPTLPETLKGLGYETWAHQANPVQAGVPSGLHRGFDRFVPHSKRGSYARAEVVNDAVLEAIAVRRANAQAAPLPPLFLYVQLMDAHHPNLEPAPANATPWERYIADVRYLDEQVGRLIDAITKELTEPTTITVTSDHGEAFREHDSVSHGNTLYREQVRIPLIVRAPGEPPGVLSTRLEGRDLHALALHFAAVGRADLRRWGVSRQRAERYTATYSPARKALHHPELHHFPKRALQRGDDYLIWNAYGDILELYDLSRDPGQRLNIVESDPSRAARLYEHMQATYRLRKVERKTVPPEQLQQLRALGYAN